MEVFYSNYCLADLLVQVMNLLYALKALLIIEYLLQILNHFLKSI